MFTTSWHLLSLNPLPRNKFRFTPNHPIPLNCGQLWFTRLIFSHNSHNNVNKYLVSNTEMKHPLFNSMTNLKTCFTKK